MASVELLFSRSASLLLLDFFEYKLFPQVLNASMTSLAKKNNMKECLIFFIRKKKEKNDLQMAERRKRGR